MEGNNYDIEALKAAQKSFDEKSFLAVTASDYETINATPDEILTQNPGKTLGELMSDQEILEYIQTTEQNIKSNEGIEKMKDYNEDLKNNLMVTKDYLHSIDRLPENI